MTEENMTVHRALAERKLLDHRIEKSILEGVFCTECAYADTKINGVDRKQREHEIQGAFDKSMSLIERRNAINRAIALSNAVTHVDIVGINYTVAEAIAMKQHGIENEQTLLNRLKHQYQRSVANITDKNIDMQRRADDVVIATYGKDNTNDSSKAEATRREFIENNSYELVDPIGIMEKIEALEQKISAFKAEVDAVLSESNAVTTIKIVY